MVNILSALINFAFEKHITQTSNDGTPYIMHPVRVMSRCHDEVHKCIAILHDVFEDTDAKWSELDTLLADVPFSIAVRIVDGTRAITKRKDETLEQYRERLCLNEDARQVKKEDINDNMSKHRSKTDDDAKKNKLRKKYLETLDYINDYEKKNCRPRYSMDS